MKPIFVDGKPVTLTDNDFIAEGGEGRVYGKGSTIYKLYTDPSKMIPSSKITELSSLKEPNILFPQKIIYDEHGKEIGFTMHWLKGSVPMCRIFANDFRDQNGFGIAESLDLIKKLIKTTEYIHSQGFLVVDGNEMNYLLDKKLTTPYFIDVDSWQTKHFPATAIMTSIRDFHTPKFNTNSDWFSLAVVISQILVGVHPYKGTHPNFKKGDMEGRMKANVSFFDPDVKLPSVARSLNNIPTELRTWLEDVLQGGKRMPPPSTFLSKAPAGVFGKAQVSQGKDFILSVLFAVTNEKFLRVSNEFIITDKTIFRNLKNEGPVSHQTSHIVLSSLSRTPIEVWIDKGEIKVRPLKVSMTIPSFNLWADEFIVVGDSVFVKYESKVIEVSFDEMPNGKCFANIRDSGNVLPLSTKFFEGGYYQDVLGKSCFTLPYKNEKNMTCKHQFFMSQMDGYKFLSAKFDSGKMLGYGVLECVASKKGKFYSFLVKIDFVTNERIVKVEECDYFEPNFIVLDNGLCIRLFDDQVFVFDARTSKQDVRVLNDPAVTNEGKLFKIGMKVLYSKNNSVYTLKMK